MKKRAQQTVGMPFGMIFAVILIVVFFAVAFVAIKSFLGFGRTVDVGLFYRNFQEEVDSAWQSQESLTNFKVELPQSIEFACFANLSLLANADQDIYKEIKRYDFYDANLFLYPPEKVDGSPYKKIEHLDVNSLSSNPLCFANGEEVTIKKDFYSKFVTVSR